MKIGEKLPILRKRCGLSQEDLANELDVSRQSVYKWETSESQPDIAKIQKMAKILGVSFDYLLDENIDVTKVDDVPKDIINTEIKYRTVFNTKKEIPFEKADHDRGIFPEDEYEEVEQKGIFLKKETKIGLFDFDKDMLENTFETSKKKMMEYLDSKGYDWLMPQPDACVAFFVDNKNKTFGFWYDDAEQFVCPIENLVDIKFSNDGGSIKNTNRPKLGLLLGSIFGVGVESESVATLEKPMIYDINITYFKEDDSTDEFEISFNKSNAYWFSTMDAKDLDFYTEMCDVIGDCINTNFGKIDAKIKALRASIEKIKTGKVKVEDINIQDLTERAKQAEIQYNNDVKKIKAQFVADKKAKKKKKLIRNLIIAGVVLLGFIILLTYNTIAK